MKFQFLSSSLLFRIMPTESANQTELTDDAQEKSARSYELKFTPNWEFTVVDHNDVDLALRLLHQIKLEQGKTEMKIFN